MTAPQSSDARRLRVLVLAPHPYAQDRGSPIAAYELVRGLTTRGCAVELLTYHEGYDPGIPGSTLLRIKPSFGIRGVPPGFSWKKVVCDLVMLSHVPRLVRGRRIDVIHAVEEASFIALLMKHVFRVPYVYDMDSSLPQQLIERYPWLGRARPLLEEFERRAIRGSLGVLAVSRSLEQLAREIAPDHLIARLEDFSLLEGGEAQPERGEPLRETTGCDGPIVLYAGNLMPYQGIDLLLAGFQRVARVHPTVQLVIIGGSDADIRTYRTRVADLGLQERVHLVGPRPTAQLGWYLGQANIVVSPRTTGTNTPMKVYSYLDSGTALLATRLPTHLQVLDDEIACLVAAEPEAIGEGLMRLLGDDELRRRLALRARERVRQEYSREAYLRKLNVFYDQVERRLKPAVGAEDADIPHASPARDELPVADR